MTVTICKVITKDSEQRERPQIEADQAIPFAAQLITVAKVFNRGVSTGTNDFRPFTTDFPKDPSRLSSFHQSLSSSHNNCGNNPSDGYTYGGETN